MFNYVTFVTEFCCFFDATNVVGQMTHQIHCAIKVNGFNLEWSVGTEIKSEFDSFYIPAAQVVENVVAGLPIINIIPLLELFAYCICFGEKFEGN